MASTAAERTLRRKENRALNRKLRTETDYQLPRQWISIEAADDLFQFAHDMEDLPVNEALQHCIEFTMEAHKKNKEAAQARREGSKTAQAAYIENYMSKLRPNVAL